MVVLAVVTHPVTLTPNNVPMCFKAEVFMGWISLLSPNHEHQITEGSSSYSQIIIMSFALNLSSLYLHEQLKTLSIIIVQAEVVMGWKVKISQAEPRYIHTFGIFVRGTHQIRGGNGKDREVVGMAVWEEMGREIQRVCWLASNLTMLSLSCVFYR